MIVLPPAALPAWLGSDQDGAHYDLACSVQEYIEKIQFSGHDALVLGDEPSAFCWTPLLNKTGGVIWRWFAAEEGWKLPTDLDTSRYPEVLNSFSFNIATTDTSLLLFDSALTGLEATGDSSDTWTLPLKQGAYQVSGFEYRDEDSHFHFYPVIQSEAS